MCRIKSGSSITNNEDLRNLITGIILRQRGEYHKDNILKMVYHYLKGSSINFDDIKITRLIEYDLNILKRNGEVVCRNGKYRTVDID